VAVTLAVTMSGRSGLTMACESSHKEDTMSLVTTRSPASGPAFPDRSATDHSGRDHPDSKPSWFWALVEALAYAGAAFDPAAALAAQRLARIREQELGHGRRVHGPTSP
jgi:hypothetical protein